MNPQKVNRPHTTAWGADPRFCVSLHTNPETDPREESFPIFRSKAEEITNFLEHGSS